MLLNKIDDKRPQHSLIIRTANFYVVICTFISASKLFKFTFILVKPVALCFHLLSCVWKPNETLALMFEILFYNHMKCFSINYYYQFKMVGFNYPKNGLELY